MRRSLTSHRAGRVLLIENMLSLVFSGIFLCFGLGLSTEAIGQAVVSSGANVSTGQGQSSFGQSPTSLPGVGVDAVSEARGARGSVGSLNSDPSAISGPRVRLPSLGPLNSVPDASGNQARQQQLVDARILGELPVLSVTQFQQFVREATGKELPLHGYRLFDRGRFSSLSNVPVPSNYVLGPGDEIDLKIWGAVDLSVRLEVDRDGQVMIPKVGPVSIVGVTAASLDVYIKKHIAKVFTNFEVSATVGKLRSIQVFVLGQARNPGAHVVSSLSTLISAVFESGGPSATGSMRRIDLVRSGRKVQSIDLYEFINTGDTSTDVRLLPGDVILIQPAGPRVALQGAIDNPAIFELLSDQENLASVLGHSGSSFTLVAPHKIVLERVDKQKVNGPREIFEVSLDQDGLKRVLRDGDLITLFRLSPKFGNAVTLRGNVASPLRYPFRLGMKISDLIPSPDALILSDYYAKKNILVQFERPTGITADRLSTDVKNDLSEINWEYASIERIDRSEVRTVLIPFNLGRAVRQKDPEHDLPLQIGDVVTVFSVNDLAVPIGSRSQFVKIIGEVNAAGIYPIKAAETLPALIARAGGMTPNAHVYATVLTRESTRAQQQVGLDQLVRRGEERLNSQLASLIQNSGDADKNISAQAQVAAQRSALERLRSLKPSGRIALELNPEFPKLPPITLEDGDVIRIPPVQNFVAVYGAVMAESSFIYREASVVQDYLDRAGLGRDADLDGVMVIRADGSVISNQANRNWLPTFRMPFMKTRIYSGDTIFVPEIVDKRTAYTQFIQGAKDWTQLFYQFGLGAAAIRTLRN